MRLTDQQMGIFKLPRQSSNIIAIVATPFYYIQNMLPVKNGFCRSADLHFLCTANNLHGWAGSVLGFVTKTSDKWPLNFPSHKSHGTCFRRAKYIAQVIVIIISSDGTIRCIVSNVAILKVYHTVSISWKITPQTGQGRARPSNLLITMGQARPNVWWAGPDILGPPKTLCVLIYAISSKQQFVLHLQIDVTSENA